MLDILWIIVPLLVLFFSFSSGNNDCSLLSSNYFQWLNPDGSLVLPTCTNGVTARNEENDSCCGQDCSEAWLPLAKSPNCQFCSSSNALLCHGSDVYSIPDPSTLPSTTLTLFKMSGVGLIALPPKCFKGLSIYKLVIENSNLTYVLPDSFTGLKSIKSLYLRNNTLDFLPQAGYLFESIQDLSVLNLENNGLRVLSSAKSANMLNLEYFSLADNPIYDLDLYFLHNSSLRFLNLRGVTFRIKPKQMEACRFTSLPKTLNTMDLSEADISVNAVKKMMELLSEKNITTLNLGFLRSSARLIFSLLPIRKSLKYLSLEGTDMNNMFAMKPRDMKYLTTHPFSYLNELNMKNCNITDLGVGETFKAFPNLKVLSLSGNNFTVLDFKPFFYSPNLYYLDLSKTIFNQIIPNIDSITNNLTALDLSFVTFNENDNSSKDMFSAFPNLEMLSLCGAYINSDNIEAMTTLENLTVLDLSNTLPSFTEDPDYYNELVSAYKSIFTKLNLSLTELHFTTNGFKLSTESTIFSSLTSLKILDLSYNLIRELSQDMFAPSLEQLKISQNLITTWYSSTISSNSKMRSLDLSNNQLTYVSDAMLNDFYKLNYLNLNSNPALICHNKVVAIVCESLANKTHNITVVGWQQYRCYDVKSNTYRQFSRPEECKEYYEEMSTTQEDRGNGQTTSFTYSPEVPKQVPNGKMFNWNWIYVIVSLAILMTVFASIVYVRWWKIKCYIHRYLSLRKARLLRKDEDSLSKHGVQYDVFVSYSDADRSWVLDHLIPSMEADGDICLCFHERDFQVGLSILENIMECMDRSHSLLLIVSKAFVRSKWCQFEMHLAQYRLIETFRDQLVLVLLEDIPRKARPQTLHHLMMTKTYLIWPEEPCREDATELFWKRLKRALKPNNNYIFDVWQ